MRTYQVSCELAKADQRTYDEVFQHPLSNNLARGEVRSMFEALGQVTEEHNGNLKIDRNGHTLVLHPNHSNRPAGHDEVMQIRHFLETSETKEAPAETVGIHLLVIVEHRQVLIYRSDLAGSIPERVVPYDPESDGRHVHSLQDHGGNIHRPAAPSFYAAVAASLHGADEVLIFGTRAGGKKLMDNLLVELELNHPEVARCVAGAILVEEKHISEEELLTKARAYYHNRAQPAAEAG